MKNLFNERIRTLRLDAELTQRALGKILFLQPSTISEWERGRNEPDYDTLIKICKHFDVSADYLLGISDF